MSKPFDATIKHLIEHYPADWLAQIGLPSHSVQVIDADLSTITSHADKVLLVHGASDWILHLELQASRDPFLPRRLIRYNVLLHERKDCPAHSVIVLLRPEADGAELSGTYRSEPPHGLGSLEFRYQVIRVWQQPVEAFLSGGLGTLPLAPLANVDPEAVPAVVQQMEERYRHEAKRPEAALLWTASYVLMGLRYPPAFVSQILKGVRGMEESSTYQLIVAKGKAQGLAEGRAEGRAEARAEALALMRKALLRGGQKKFGPPDERTRAALDSINEPERLQLLTERLVDAATWEEWIAP